MKKSFFLLFLFGFMVKFADAQKSDLIVKTSEKGLFLEHKIAPKESFYSIGRLYTVHPKYIAAYNKLDMNKGLAIGQVVRIPLTDTNFTQKGNTGTPVYYRIGEKESLSKVSSLHKNVSLDNLRGWNGLTDNTVGAGNQLVVGFLISKEMPAVTLTPKVQAKEPKQATVIEAKKEEAVTIAPTPAAEKPVEKKEEAKVEPKKTEPVFAKQETKPASSENGFFKHYFDQQARQTPVKKDETVTAGIFKTTSGWVDAKYYLLIDAVQPGTIVKITNPANNKYIYAKVLGEMSGIRQNQGLNIRISSAGAAALQIAEEDKFIVKVNY